MCPGGTVVPAAAYQNTNIVNGMSLYMRDGKFANAACVAGVHPDKLIGREATPEEALDWLEALEEVFTNIQMALSPRFAVYRILLTGKSRQKLLNQVIPWD